MKLAVGPLTTGTYAYHSVAHKGKYHVVQKDVDGVKFGMSEDKEHEGIKWHLEKVGENRFKARHISNSSSVTVAVNPVGQALEAVEGESEWIIEPTGVDGEYSARPALDPSVFVTATGNEPVLKVGPSQSDMTRFNVYRIDDN